MALTRDVSQLLLQVDASVALAQRNLNQLAQSVDGQASQMDQALGRVDKAFTRLGKSASSSAEVFIQGRKAADDLIGAIDPLYAAQVRYDRELEKAQGLQRQGQLTAAEFAKVQTGLKAQLNDQIGLYGGVAKGMGNTRIAQMELLHVVRGSVDQYAAGANMTQIFAMHIGMLGEAAALSGSSMGKMGEIMSGPWGIAMIAGVAILATLIGKHHDTAASVDELVDRMRKQHNEALNQEAANQIWAKSIDGVRESQERLRQEFERSLQTEAVIRLQNRDKAQANLVTQQTLLNKDTAELDRLPQRKTLEAQLQDPNLDPGSVASIQQQITRIDFLEKEIAGLRKDIAASQKTIVDMRLAVADAAADASTNSSTAITQVADSFKALVEGGKRAGAVGGKISVEDAQKARTAINLYAAALQAASAQTVDFNRVGNVEKLTNLSRGFAAGKVSVSDYAKALTQATKALNDAAKAAANAKHSGYSGREIGFAEAKSIAVRAGFQVNSSQRPSYIKDEVPGGAFSQERLYNAWIAAGRPKDNPVAPPGTSAHEGAKGRWALDIQLAPGLTAGKIKKAFADQGVSVNVFPERGHLHVSGSRSQAVAAETAAKHAEVAGIRQAGAFDQASDRLDQELLQAKLQLTDDYHEQATIAAKQVDAEMKKLLDSIQEQEDLGKATGYQQGITEAQGKILRAKVDELDSAKKSAITTREAQERDRQAQAIADQRYGFDLDELHFADDLATTNRERRRIQLQIIDVMYEQKLLDLEYAKKQAERNNNLEEANRLQAQIEQVPQDKARDQERAKNGTLDPLEQWAKSVPQTADEIITAIHSIEARGLDDLSSALTEVIMGTKSLGAAFKDVARSIIADIIQMTIKMLIFRALSNVLGSVGGSVSGGAGGAPGGATYFATRRARAKGGPVRAGEAYIVGEKQPELFVPKSDGVILPKVPRIGLPQGGGGAGGNLTLTVNVHARDAVLTNQVKSWVADGILEAAPHIVRAAQESTIRNLQRPRLPG